MNKMFRVLMTGVLFVSSLLFFGNKPQAPATNQQSLNPQSQNLVLKHAKDMLRSFDTPSALAWHSSHYSHGSHGSHGSHSSHSSHYSSSW